MNKENLAIYQHKDDIVKAVSENQVIVIEAPTGSGKTTQIPQILFESGLNGWGTIGVTQPRRIAAFGVSSRIAYEMNCELGRLVGYKIRFEDVTSSNTKIKIMTDGILLEELRSDHLLLKYSVIIVDEAHERSLNIDFILGLLKEIIRERKDLKIVISSATINAKLFSDYFSGAPIISVKTKPYPIEIKYIPNAKKDDYEIMQNKIIEIVSDLESKNSVGDILIFLPGEDTIKECLRRLELLNTNGNLEIIPLYARLAPEEQNKVFDVFPGKRKIVVATNIAETSLTIDGIIYVIDSGFSKINYYNARTFTSFLELKPISKASCDQRTGRAGRTAPGIVYRLYSEEDYKNREEYTKEEIYRTDLSEVVLRMADLGINNYFDFDFISPPNRGAINSAIETLVSLEALTVDNKLTELGKKMVDFPLLPRLGRILLEASLNYPDVTNAILIIISFLSAKSPFLYPPGEEIESRQAQKKLASKGGDFFS
ncbi:MAG TPA: ATP-dependent RNA helicase, partial [Spirochaetota bacterium]|nr:ATP-dependent RNA helicase [Spirochaetota bacterium]